MKKRSASIFFMALIAPILWIQGQPPFSDVKGPYLGQKPPGMTPQVFAPGIVSTGLNTRDIAITPDGKHLFFMSSRTPPREQWPAKLSAAWLQRLAAEPGIDNTSIYWVDTRIIDTLRPKTTAEVVK